MDREMVFLAPVMNSYGDPACPLCGSGLVFVEKIVLNAESRVTACEVDESDPRWSYLMPTIEGTPEREQTLEVLETRMECDRYDCGYRVEGTRLGEVERS